MIVDRLFRICFTPLSVVATRVLFSLRVEGARFLPREGPALLVPNHSGYLDPLLLQMGTPRPIRYMVTSDFYDLRSIQPFFRMVGAIRIAEDGSNRESLRSALTCLNRGDLVGIFPEGRLSRDGRLGQVLPGAAFLAARSGAPVVPARVRGSFDVMPRGTLVPRQAHVLVRFGPPIKFPKRKGREAAQRIRDAWEEL